MNVIDLDDFSCTSVSLGPDGSGQIVKGVPRVS
jgi:hypothetical protein